MEKRYIKPDTAIFRSMLESSLLVLQSGKKGEQLSKEQPTDSYEEQQEQAGGYRLWDE